MDVLDRRTIVYGMHCVLCVFIRFYVMCNVFTLFYSCVYFVRNDEIKLWYIVFNECLYQCLTTFCIFISAVCVKTVLRVKGVFRNRCWQNTSLNAIFRAYEWYLATYFISDGIIRGDQYLISKLESEGVRKLDPILYKQTVLALPNPRQLPELWSVKISWRIRLAARTSSLNISLFHCNVVT